MLIGFLIVLLIVLAGLLVVGRPGRAPASPRSRSPSRSSEEAQRQGVTSSEPDVDVGGFPFLTQVLAGKYEEITIVLRDVRARSTAVT